MITNYWSFGVTLSAPMEFDGVWMCVCVCMMMREAFDEPLDQHQSCSTRATRLDQSRNFLDSRSTPFVLLDRSSEVQPCPLFSCEISYTGLHHYGLLSQHLYMTSNINRSPHTHPWVDSNPSQIQNPSLFLFLFSKCNTLLYELLRTPLILHIIQAS